MPDAHLTTLYSSSLTPPSTPTPTSTGGATPVLRGARGPQPSDSLPVPPPEVPRSTTPHQPNDAIVAWVEEADRLDRITPVSFRVNLTALEVSEVVQEAAAAQAAEVGLEGWEGEDGRIGRNIWCGL